VSFKRRKIYLVLSSILVLMIFNSRPAIFGQVYGGVYFLLTVFIFLLTYWASNKSKIRKEVYYILLMYIFLYFYYVIQYVIIGTTDISEILSSFLLLSIGFFGFIALKRDVFFFSVKVLNYFYLILFSSYLITLLMYGLNHEFLVTQLNIESAGGRNVFFPIYFPFSITYDGLVRILGEYYPRVIGNYREPGLLQMVLIILFWINHIYKVERYKVFNISLILLLILTFSTAGYALFLITMVIYFITNYKLKTSHYFYIFLTIGLFGLFAGFEGRFGLLQKLDSQSGIMRIQAALVSIDLLKENPLFGIGLYQDYMNYTIGINFIGTMAQIGIIGTTLVLLPIFYTGTLILRSNKKYLFVIWTPFVFTLLFSQPLYDKALSLFILMVIVFLLKNEFPKNFNNHPILQSGQIPGRDNPIRFKSELYKP